VNVAGILKTIGEQINAFASGKLAFAEAVSVGDRLVIPVAWVRYDFGAGGSTPAAYRRMAKEAGGGGGGGQVSVIPAGIIEITPTVTRFIPIPDGKKIFALVASSFASSGMNNGGGSEGDHNGSGFAKRPTKKSAGKRAAGGTKKAAAKKTPAKKSTAKKAASVKSSRPLARKAAPAKTSAKKKTSSAATKKSAAKKR
jgi:uncharacterized spore protein YtfJ